MAETLEEQIFRQMEHVGGFRGKFPAETQRINEAAHAAMQFKNMLLGHDTEEAPWSDEDKAIAGFLDRAELDLFDASQELWMGRLKPAMVILRCYLEQLFFALYYQEQSIDFALWQRDDKHFVMLHQLYDKNHSFRKYFSNIFKERKDPEWGTGKNDKRFSNKIFEDLEDLYSALCAPVHGRPDQREREPGTLATSEVKLFCDRLCAAICIATEFFDAAGTGEDNPIPAEFRLTKELKIQ